MIKNIHLSLSNSHHTSSIFPIQSLYTPFILSLSLRFLSILLSTFLFWSFEYLPTNLISRYSLLVSFASSSLNYFPCYLIPHIPSYIIHLVASLIFLPPSFLFIPSLYVCHSPPHLVSCICLPWAHLYITLTSTFLTLPISVLFSHPPSRTLIYLFHRLQYPAIYHLELAGSKLRAFHLLSHL